MNWNLDTILRLVAAATWVVIFLRSATARTTLIRRLGTACLSLVLVVVAMGPTLLPLVGGPTLTMIYTATATIVAIIGIGIVTSRHLDE